MIVSPADFVAFAQETGSPIPSTPAERAALAPIVNDWKAARSQRAAAAPNALGPVLLGAGLLAGAGAGLYALNRSRTPSPPSTPPAARPNPAPPSLNTPTRGGVNTYRRKDGTIRQSGDIPLPDPSGFAPARLSGIYSPGSITNSDSVGPVLRLTDPQLQQQALDQVAITSPGQVDAISRAFDRLRNPEGVDPIRFSGDNIADLNLDDVKPGQAVLHTPRGGGASIYRLKVDNTTGQRELVNSDARHTRLRIAPNDAAAYDAVNSRNTDVTYVHRSPKYRTTGQPGWYEDDENLKSFIQVDQPLPDHLTKAGYTTISTDFLEGADELGDVKVLARLNDKGTRVPVTYGQARGDGAIGHVPLSSLLQTSAMKEREDEPVHRFAAREDEKGKALQEPLPASRMDPTTYRHRQHWGWDPVTIDGIHHTIQPNDEGRLRPVPLPPPEDDRHPIRKGHLPGIVSTPQWQNQPVADEFVYTVRPFPLESTTAYRDAAIQYSARGQTPPSVGYLINNDGKLGRAITEEAAAKSVAVDLAGNPIDWSVIQASRQSQDPTQVFHRWWGDTSKESNRPMIAVPVQDKQGRLVYDTRSAAADARHPMTIGYAERTAPDAPPYTGPTAEEGLSDVEDLEELLIGQRSSNLSNPTAPAAAARLMREIKAGELQTPGQIRSRVIELARENQTDRLSILRAAHAIKGRVTPPPAPVQGPRQQAIPVGGHSSRDPFTHTLSSIAAQQGLGVADLEAAVLSGDPQQLVAARRAVLKPAANLAEIYARRFSSSSPKAADERLSIATEAAVNAIEDYPRAIEWARQNEPELAARIDSLGQGSPWFDQFMRPYVRRAILEENLGALNEGLSRAPLYKIPAATSELIAARAIQNGRTVDEELQATIAGARSPIEAVLALDDIESAATSPNLKEPYTTGSRLAEAFYRSQAPGADSAIGRRRARLGATSTDRYSPAALPGPTEQPTAVTPIAIKFATGLPATDDGNISEQLFRVEPSLEGGRVVLRRQDSNLQPAEVQAMLIAQETDMRHKRAKASRSRGGAVTADGSPNPRQMAPFRANTILNNRMAANLAGVVKDTLAKGSLSDAAATAARIIATDSASLDTQAVIDDNRAAIEEAFYRLNTEGPRGDGQGLAFDFDPNRRVKVVADRFSRSGSLDAVNPETTKADTEADVAAAPHWRQTVRDYNSPVSAATPQELAEATRRFRSAGYGTSTANTLTPEQRSRTLQIARQMLDAQNTTEAAAPPVADARAAEREAEARYMASFIQRRAGDYGPAPRSDSPAYGFSWRGPIGAQRQNRPFTPMSDASRQRAARALLARI